MGPRADFTILVVGAESTFATNILNGGDTIPLIDGEIITATFVDLPEGSPVQAEGCTFALTDQLKSAGTVGLKVTVAP